MTFFPIYRSFKLFTTIKASSLYNLTSFWLMNFVRCDDANTPTSSNISAPSWFPVVIVMVTSEQD